jgi:hypothetical protein
MFRRLFQGVQNDQNSSYELDSITNFDEYTFSELAVKILYLNKGFSVQRLNQTSDSFLGTFESERTKLVLCYNRDGIFVAKISEIWK